MEKQEAHLIIDIGTGNVRVAVAALKGTVLGIAREDIQYHKDELYLESLYFDPNQLWEQLISMSAVALNQANYPEILAITATSQREGIVLIDKNGQSQIGLPNIDHRGREWESILKDKNSIYNLSGRYPTSLFSAMKLVGIRERRSEIWNNLATFMSISDWAEYQLSGIAHYEHSQASETLLYDVAQKTWSEELCEVFDFNRSLLPPLVNSGTILGTITPSAAAAFKISSNAKVIVGGADTQLAILGTSPATDDVVIVSGTTTPIIKLTGSYVTDLKQRTWTGRHVDADSFMFEANAGVTGLNYQRLKEVFYPNESYEVIEQELAELTHFQCVASLGSVLADERSSLTIGGFIFEAPVTHQLTRASFVWATLWDIACSIAENYKTLHEVAPHEASYVWVCGGGVQSPTLRGFIAGLINKKVRCRAGYQQSSVVGGVMICNAALGIAQAPAVTLAEVLPEPTSEYAAWYQKWAATRNSFREILS